MELLEALETSDRDALAFVDSLGVIEPVTFRRLAREAGWWADLLREVDVHPGNRVVVMAGDKSWPSALLGVLEAGCVALPFPAATSVAELRASAGEAGAVAFVSNRARPDLVEPEGIPVLSDGQLDTMRGPSGLRHMAMPDDAALIIDGAAFSHGSMLAQADAAAQWLELREGERVWSTTTTAGSLESIWLLFAAWRAGAEIVDVERSLDLIEQLELLHRFEPAVVWFSDTEYGVLAEAAEADPAWAQLGPIRRALASDEGTGGASLFGREFGVEIALASAGPLAGLYAAAGPLPDVVAEPESAEAAKRRRKEEKLAQRREKEEAKKLRKAEEARRREEEESRKRAEQAERAEREAAAAEEGRLAEEAKRAEREAAEAEEQRRREEGKNRKLAEKAERIASEAEARRRAEEAKIAQREAAKAEEERRRVEKAVREAAKAEEKRRAEEAKTADRESAKAEDQGRRAEEAKVAERQAAKAEEQRLRDEEKNRELAEKAAAGELRREAQRAKELQKAEEQRLREEEKARKVAERAERDQLAADANAAAQRLRAEEAERKRLEGEAADAETARERHERIDHEERHRELQIPQEAAHPKSDRDIDIVSRISDYGIGT